MKLTLNKHGTNVKHDTDIMILNWCEIDKHEIDVMTLQTIMKLTLNKISSFVSTELYYRIQASF